MAANFLNFPIINGFASGGSAKPELDGDNLISLDSILSVSVATTGVAGSEVTKITLQLSPTALTNDTCVVTVSESSDAVDPDGGAPYVGSDNAAGHAAYNAKLRSAVMKAMTANPGGVKSTVVAPQSQVSSAKWMSDKSVYFKDFVVS